MLKFIKQNRRSITYAFALAIGVVFIQQLYTTAATSVVLIAIMVLWGVLILELFANYYFSTNLLKQLNLPAVQEYTPRNQLIFHAVLPTGSLLSILGFVYTNNIYYLSSIYFVSTFCIFCILFINIRAYYEDKFKLEENTHLVYDIIKILIYFCSIDFVLNTANRYGFNFFIVVGVLFCLSSLLTLLVLLKRKHFNDYILVLILLAGLTLAYLTTVIFTYLAPNPLITAFYSTLIFYIFNAVLHHELERTLKLSIIAEYVLVGIICLLIIILMT